MDQNVCGLDRTVRLVAGSLLVVLALVVATYAGTELLVTGLTQWCPGNRLLGIDTCR